MKDLVNKLFLFATCSYLLWQTGIEAVSIVAFSIAATITCLCSYLEFSKKSIGLIVIYCVLCLMYPCFGLYLPLILYDVFRWKNMISIITIIIATISLIIWLPKSLLVPFFLFVVTSILFAFYSDKTDKLVKELHLIRDESAESTMILQQRNQALIQNQNYEIHVATLSERNRIAREIHDNVGHMLTRSILQTGALKVINKDSTLDEPISTLHDTLNTAMTSIRNSVHDLHDDAIDMHTVLKDLVSEVESPVIALEYDMETSIPREVKYAFIAIIKEAINNMQKHSDADSATIRLEEHPGFYHLEIEDNGSIQQLPSTSDGIGLTNMRERVRNLGGTIHISVKNGFYINISILKKGK